MRVRVCVRPQPDADGEKQYLWHARHYVVVVKTCSFLSFAIHIYLVAILIPSRLFLACVWYRFVWINPCCVCGVTNIAQITEHNRKRSETVNSCVMDSQKRVMATTYHWNQALLMLRYGKYLMDPAVSTLFSQQPTPERLLVSMEPSPLICQGANSKSQEILFSRNFPWVPVSPPPQLFMFSYPKVPV